VARGKILSLESKSLWREGEEREVYWLGIQAEYQRTCKEFYIYAGQS
jgi:hypothetical protein